MDAALIGLVGLGGLYTIASQDKKNNKEGFKSKLPNTNTPPINYPLKNKNSVNNNVNYYPTANSATDKYFNADLFNQLVEENKNTGSYLSLIHI